MSITHIISDFDGVYTDLNLEFKEYEQNYNDSLASLLKTNQEDLERCIALKKKQVKNNPASAWMVGGFAVCPAAIDPIILHTASVVKLLTDMRNGTNGLGHAYIPSVEQWANMEKEIHFDAYGRCTSHFRSGAKEFLNDLLASFDRVVIVTESLSNKVYNKLDKLGDFRGRIQVYGNARKRVIDDGFDVLPRSFFPFGFPRPVLLRRKQYYEALELFKTEGFDPKNSAVIGDNFETDLALPYHVGFRIIQFATNSTPMHEATFHGVHDRAHLADSYDEVLKILKTY